MEKRVGRLFLFHVISEMSSFKLLFVLVHKIDRLHAQSIFWLTRNPLNVIQATQNALIIFKLHYLFEVQLFHKEKTPR